MSAPSSRARLERSSAGRESHAEDTWPTRSLRVPNDVIYVPCFGGVDHPLRELSHGDSPSGSLENPRLRPYPTRVCDSCDGGLQSSFAPWMERPWPYGFVGLSGACGFPAP